MFVLIGLCGGTVEARGLVSAVLVDKAGRGLGAWVHSSLVGAKSSQLRSWHKDKSRANALEVVLEGLPEMKAGTPDAGLVVSHVLTEEEAAMIRAAGGHIWHLADPVSSTVAIERADLLITPIEGGERHFLDPIEALGEQLVRDVRAALARDQVRG